MAAGRLNLVWQQGTPFRRVFEARAGSASGPVRDLSGWSARLQVRVRMNDPQPLADVSTTDDDQTFLTLDGEAGQLILEVPAEFSAALTIRRGVYGINLFTPEGEPVPFLEGRWTLRPRAIR